MEKSREVGMAAGVVMVIDSPQQLAGPPAAGRRPSPVSSEGSHEASSSCWRKEERD